MGRVGDCFPFFSDKPLDSPPVPFLYYSLP
jgi:hypothetical protein